MIPKPRGYKSTKRNKNFFEKVVKRAKQELNCGMNGVCLFWSETGTEGGYWAFQDRRFIKPPTETRSYLQYDYKGLHLLGNGDRLVIYDKKDQKNIVWDGVIDLVMHGLFTEHAQGYWIHADQAGVDRDIWARWFFEEYPATLVPAVEKLTTNNKPKRKPRT